MLQKILEYINYSELNLIVANSENNKTQTLELFDIVKKTPIIVFGYNSDDEFEIKAYQKGMFAYFTLSTPQKLINAQLISAFNYAQTIEKNVMYRDMLVKNNLITKNNEVFLDFNDVLDREFVKIHNSSIPATLLAISPDDKSKFLILPNKIETTILNNIRKNDILMNYASNKYFLLLNNTNLTKAELIWKKLQKYLPKGLFAGMAYVGNKNREQVINDALNKLHTAINSCEKTNVNCNIYSGDNFKFFRQEFIKKIEQIITPVFYQIQQMYNEKLYGMKIEIGQGEGYGVLYIKSRYKIGSFKITSPGFSTINIDITYEDTNPKRDEEKSFPLCDSKRITIEPEELEAGLLHDLLEQFILEFKNDISE